MDPDGGSGGGLHTATGGAADTSGARANELGLAWISVFSLSASAASSLSLTVERAVENA
jgi:hypothetical protein